MKLLKSSKQYIDSLITDIPDAILGLLDTKIEVYDDKHCLITAYILGNDTYGVEVLVGDRYAVDILRYMQSKVKNKGDQPEG